MQQKASRFTQRHAGADVSPLRYV